jgi:hypothetical protein
VQLQNTDTWPVETSCVTKGVSLVSTVHQVISETVTTAVSLVDCVSGSVW